MSPIEFPDEPLLTGQRGGLGLMIWSSLPSSLNPGVADSSFLTGTDLSGKKETGDNSFFSLNDDDFQPDSIWLEAETGQPVTAGRKKFSLAWSRSGALLGRVQWSENLFQGSVNASNSCAISGPAFFVSGDDFKLPFSAPLVLQEEELVERVMRSIEFARVFSDVLPCVLCLNQELLEDVLGAGLSLPVETETLDQLAQIARLQASMGMADMAGTDEKEDKDSQSSFINYAKAAQAARSSWLASH